ncbi:chitosanase [Fodinicola feengrottensis]|uniref:chitosanase n=1 Tax=Fodinicola feengrottensis TaxID=435914 RepID=UPI002442703E|nr:chitosanase [Fodinicola feengrottensis]
MTTLADTAKKEIAMQLVSSAENSSLDWRAQYGYIEDIGDGRGYTGGIIGFTSGTGDMLRVVERYAVLAPKAGLLRFLLALRKVNGTASHTGGWALRSSRLVLEEDGGTQCNVSFGSRLDPGLRVLHAGC